MLGAYLCNLACRQNGAGADLAAPAGSRPGVTWQPAAAGSFRVAPACAGPPAAGAGGPAELLPGADPASHTAAGSTKRIKLAWKPHEEHPP